MADPPSCLNAAHEPNASAGLISTLLSVTCKSFLGIANLITSPGCICPGRPIASSTCFHSLAAFGAAALSAWPSVKGLFSKNNTPTTALASLFDLRKDRPSRKFLCMIPFSFSCTHQSYSITKIDAPDERIQDSGQFCGRPKSWDAGNKLQEGARASF